MNKFFVSVVLLALTVALTGCGAGFQTTTGPRGEQGPAGPQGPQGPAAPPTTTTSDEVQQDIDSLLADENTYRLGLGQTALTNGLSCSVQQVLSGQKINAASTASGTVIVTTGTKYTYLYKGAFNQPSLPSGGTNLIPASIRPLFVGVNYLITCTGYLVVRETDYYGFTLNSDDGSILTIDGTQVINNDGNHGMVIVSGTKYLRRGVRSFKLEYAQTGGGAFGLILTAGGESIDSKFYAH